MNGYWFSTVFLVLDFDIKNCAPNTTAHIAKTVAETFIDIMTSLVEDRSKSLKVDAFITAIRAPKWGFLWLIFGLGSSMQLEDINLRNKSKQSYFLSSTRSNHSFFLKVKLVIFRHVRPAKLAWNEWHGMQRQKRQTLALLLDLDLVTLLFLGS